MALDFLSAAAYALQSQSELLKKNNYIQNTHELDALCWQLSRHSTIALDTEFMRTKTYYPQPCLLQIADPQQVFLIDLIRITDYKAVCQAIVKTKKTKVMHGCEQDLEVLNQLCGYEIKMVFDTQLAAAFMAYGYQIGYKNLVEKCLGVRLKNEQTRSDWARRPLSKKQKDYARDDVAHLLPLWDLLSRELKRDGKYDWFLEESLCRLRERQSKQERQRWSPDENPKSWSFLQRAEQWRESKARQINRPRQWLVSDACLAAISKRRIDQSEAIRKLEKCSRVRVDYAQVLARFMEEQNLSGVSVPAADEKRWRLTEKEKDCLKKINQLVMELARRHKISVQLLAKRRDLIHCVRRRDCSKWRQGWRREVFSSSGLRQINRWLDAL